MQAARTAFEGKLEGCIPDDPTRTRARMARASQDRDAAAVYSCLAEPGVTPFLGRMAHGAGAARSNRRAAPAGVGGVLHPELLAARIDPHGGVVFIVEPTVLDFESDLEVWSWSNAMKRLRNRYAGHDVARIGWIDSADVIICSLVSSAAVSRGSFAPIVTKSGVS